jgi:hypothetical protein
MSERSDSPPGRPDCSPLSPESIILMVIGSLF